MRMDARLSGTTNRCELPLNIVSLNKPKVLTGLNQKVCGRMLSYMVGAHGQQSHRWIGRVYPARVTYAEHGKPVSAPSEGRRTARNAVGGAGKGLSEKANAVL